MSENKVENWIMLAVGVCGVIAMGAITSVIVVWSIWAVKDLLKVIG